MSMTFFPDDSDNLYHKAELVAEIGFAFEKEVFGGIADQRPGRVSISNWPNSDTPDDYVSRDAAIALRSQTKPPALIRWRAKPEQVNDFFRREFWDGLEDRKRKSGRSPFKLDKVRIKGVKAPST